MVRRCVALVLALGALAAAGGCASTAQRDEALRRARAALEAKPVCCKSTREFLFPRMRVPYESAFFIDTSAPVFAFTSGKSYFRSFELPPFEQPYLIEIESRMVGGPTASEQWLFHPVLLLLDQEHRVVATARSLRFRPLLDGRNVLGMGTQLAVDERGRAARYLVIYTEPDAMSRTFDFGTVRMSMGAPHNMEYSVPYGYEGRIILRTRAGIPAPPQRPG